MTVNLWAKFDSFIFRLYTELVDLHAVVKFEYKLQLCLLEHFCFGLRFKTDDIQLKSIFRVMMQEGENANYVVLLKKLANQI